MDTLTKRQASATNAVGTLLEALDIDRPSPLERDGTIQRFEYCFEAVWKLGRRYLSEVEGLQAPSPKAVIRALAAVGVLDEAETASARAMADDRNLTSHTYDEPRAVQIHSRIAGHATVLRAIASRVGDRLPR